MAKKTKTSEADIESYRHENAKRVLIPSAENQSLVPDDDKAIKVLRYKRNPDLDPQLVWRGKDVEDDALLDVVAPPIYRQEHIHPRQLIENLKRETQKRLGAEPGAQVDFFHDFNGVDPASRTDFYGHDANWQNRMILGDSLLVMGSLAEREALRGKVQCIYFDPPYGIKFNSNWQPSTKSRDVKDGKGESISREPEVVRAFRDTWKNGIHSYLSYLRDRLTLPRDLLHETGSLFVQIGDENIHLVRCLLDELFGEKNAIATITVQKAGSTFSRYLGSTADYVLWYAVDAERVKYREVYQEREISDDDAGRFTLVELPSGERYSRAKVGKVPAGARLYAPDPLESAGMGREKGEGAASWFRVKFQGREFSPSDQTRWKTNELGMARLIKADRLVAQATRLRFQKYIDDFPVQALTNIWTDLAGASDKVYVVQTATKIVQRCLLMATDPGDLVLDPTCGSGTTAYVAEQWGRRWITIDTSRVALTLARARLMGARFDYYLLRDSEQGSSKESEITGRQPAAGPFHNDLRQGFVCERAPKVSLGAIVRNAEIDTIWERFHGRLEALREMLTAALGETWEDWQVPREAGANWSEAAKANHAEWWRLRRGRQEEINASIARNADVEILYDRPYKAKGVVRVAGPFTVESLSPHRVLPSVRSPTLLTSYSRQMLTIRLRLFRRASRNRQQS